MTDTPDPLGQLEHRLGTVLRRGVTFSALALALGLAEWLWRAGPESAWLLDAGLLALTVTPVLRVVVSLAGYVRMRDWFFVATTAVVLLELGLVLASALHRR